MWDRVGSLATARSRRRCPATGPSGCPSCWTVPRACSSGTRTTRASSCGRAATSRSAARTSSRSRTTSARSTPGPVHYEGVHWDPRYPQTTDVVEPDVHPGGGDRGVARAPTGTSPSSCASTPTPWATPSARWTSTSTSPTVSPCSRAASSGTSPTRRSGCTDRWGREYFGYGGDFGDAPQRLRLQRATASSSPTAPRRRSSRRSGTSTSRSGSRSPTTRSRSTTGTSSPPASDLDCVVTLAPRGHGARRGRARHRRGPGDSPGLPLPVTRAPHARRVRDRRVVPAPPGDRAGRRPGTRSRREQRVIVVAGTTPARPGPRRGADPGRGHPQHRGPGQALHRAVLPAARGPGLVPLRPDARTAAASCCGPIPQPNFWHAPTSNERGWGMPFRDGHWLLASRYREPLPSQERPVVAQHADHVEVRYAYLLPTTPHSECEVVYRVFGSGRVEVTLVAAPGSGPAGPARVRHALHRRRGPAPPALVRRRAGGVLRGPARRALGSASTPATSARS